MSSPGSDRDLPVTNGESAAEPFYRLRLYISGITPRSTAALANLKQISDEYLAGRFDLEVIDVYQDPKMARQDQIVAVPTLLKLQPAPSCRLVGDMSDRDRVLHGLGLRPHSES